MSDSISSLVGVDDETPQEPEKVEEAPSATDEAPKEQSDTSETDTVIAPTTAPSTTLTTTVNEPTPQQEVDAVMEALNRLIGDGIGTTQNCKVMIYGDPGQGKSSIATTAPNNLVFDFEDGLISAAKAPHGVAKNVRPMPYVNFKQAEAILQKLQEKNPALDWVEVFTIDTLTDFSRRTLADICERDYLSAPSQFNKYQPKTEQYTENNEQMDRYVRGLKDLDRDLILLCHAKTVDPKGKPSKTYPDFSESLANKLEAKMDVVGYLQMQEIEGVPTPVMITKSTTSDLVHCKSRIDIPDIMVDPTWDKIKEGWERTQAKLREMQNGAS